MKSLRQLPPVNLTKADRRAKRISPVEQTIYQINVKLLRFKMEKDNDIHLVVAEPGARKLTMIVEFVLPACGKRRTMEMTNARNALFAACGLPPKKGFRHLARRKGVATATITGVGFYDYVHRQNGVAPHGIELHPVLSFQATSPCIQL